MIPLIPIVIGAGAIIAWASLSAFISHLRNVSINQGYEKASKEFNEKYEEQYNKFMSKEKTWEKNRQEYEDLIKAYEKYVEELRREYEDLKRNGAASASAAALAVLRSTPVLYGAGLEKEVAYYEKCLANLRGLKGSDT